MDLLGDGETTRLPVATREGVRGGTEHAATSLALVPSRPSRSLRADQPPALLSDVFALLQEEPRQQREAGVRLRLKVVHGNLKFVSQPLMLGHYRGLKLSGTEAVIDRLLNGTMSESVRAGLYPSGLGSSQVFVNVDGNSEDPFAVPRPEAALVVGLGDEGSLRANDLIQTGRQAVLAYAQRVAEGGGSSAFELAATLIGSGGSSVTPGTSAQALAIGVQQANQRLAQVCWPQVSQLHLIELYLDRGTEALQGLSALSGVQAEALDLEPKVQVGIGGLLRPMDSNYRGASYDFLNILQQCEEGPDARIEFALSTHRARNEVRGVMPQSKLVREFVCAGANAANRDPRIGRSLFKLLVPLEIEPFLSGSTGLLMQLDGNTAAYPWELLESHHPEREGGDDKRPWGIRTRLLGTLRTADYRAQPQYAARDGAVLIIGEPQCPPDKYPPLPAAANEARAVAEVFGVDAILGGDALAIAGAVLDRSFAILHVAGHGDIIDDIGGVVLSNGATFGPREIKAMRMVPDLAFINCCHLGRFDREPLKKINTLGASQPLPEFAANVAEQLIKDGVRCVITAGWAVDDEPAALFARSFYQELLRGSPFDEAVGKARETTWRKFPHSNTWATYQCYGDPNWTYVKSTAAASGPSQLPEIATWDALKLRLKALEIAHAYKDCSSQDVCAEVEQLESLYSATWGSIGDVAASFGAVYAETGDFWRAIDWYERALSAEDGTVTLHALEQLGNAQARYGATCHDPAEARNKIQAGVATLERVNAIAATAERQSLLASAYKRLAITESKVPRRSRAQRLALTKSLEHYSLAEEIARRQGADDLFYPAMNRMSIALVLSAGDASPEGFDSASIGAVRQSLQRKNAANADFWSVIGLTELRLYEALAKRDLATALQDILQALKDLRARTASERMWGSVFDQTKFTLTSYLRATGLARSEREAARALLNQLEAWSTANR